MPFLENVTRGRGIPRERLAEVGEHYFLFGGRSPINDQCRDLLAALRASSTGGGSTCRCLGQPQLEPYLGDVAGSSRRRSPPGAGADHQCVPVVLLLPAVPREPVRRLRRHRHRGRADPPLRRPPGLRDRLGGRHRGRARRLVTDWAATASALVFVTHSIPTAMAESAGPPPKARGRLRRLAPAGGRGGDPRGRRAAGDRRRPRPRLLLPLRPADPALAGAGRQRPPDRPAAAGEQAVVAIPIGFVSDHMEVIFDLDTEAAATAARAGPAVRPGGHRGHPPRLRDRAGRPDGGARRGGPRRAVEQPVCRAAWSAGTGACPVAARTCGSRTDRPCARSPGPCRVRRRTRPEYPRPDRVVAARAERHVPACPCGIHRAGHGDMSGPTARKGNDGDRLRRPPQDRGRAQRGLHRGLKTRRNDKNSGKVDEDEAEAAESFELPGADLSHEELTVRVLPQQSDEFTCAGCFLVRHRSQIAEQKANGNAYCYDCAG